MTTRTNDETVQIGRELIEVGEKLRKIRAQLDTSTEPCGSCGLQHARNLPEKKAAEQLDGAIGRVEKVVEFIGASLDQGNAR